MKIKNEDERLAYSALSKENMKIVYEPIKNSPPDFLINNTTAVEVTRLNQKKRNQNGNIIDLENEWYKVHHAIDKLFDKYDNSKEDSHFVFINYDGPIKKIKTLIKSIKSILDELNYNYKNNLTFEVDDYLEIRISKSEFILSRRFEIGSLNNIHKGGFVEELLIENINRILLEKSAKIKNVAFKYSNWRLILVDYIDYCHLSPDELVNVKNRLSKDHLFDEIVMINHLEKNNIIKLI